MSNAVATDQLIKLTHSPRSVTGGYIVAMDESIAAVAERLVEFVRQFESCIVAF